MGNASFFINLIMERYNRLLIVFFLFAGLTSNAQNVQYIYADTLFSGKVDVNWDLLREKLEERDLPDDIIDGMISYQKKKHAQRKIIVERRVDLGGDSSFIELNDKSPYKNINYGWTTPRLLILEGLLYRQDSRSKEYIKTRIEDSSANFIATGRAKKILGYECQEYQSLNKLYTAWITTLLPVKINPGIPHINLPGAIMAVEINLVNAIQKIEIARIKPI